MSWKKIVKSIAPTLGAALGGPMAGVAIKALSDSLLGEDALEPEQQLEELISTASPEQLVKIKQIEKDFELQMKKLDVDVFALEVKDRDSARIHHKDSVMPALLVVLLTVLVAAGTAALIFVQVPETNRSIVYMLFGQILTAWVAANAYWFGTSKSSQDKTKLLGAPK